MARPGLAAALAAAIFMGVPALADLRATDETGRKVILHDNGTWSVAGSDRQQPAGGGAFTAESVGMVDADVYEFPFRNWNQANWGEHIRLGIGSQVNGNQDTRRRSYIRFDPQPVLDALGPRGRVILQLDGENREPGRRTTGLVLRVTSPWNEGRGVLHEGQVERSARRGEVSWVNQPQLDLSRIWGQMDLSADKGTYSVDITDLVVGWGENRFPNYGLALVGRDEGNGRYSYIFHSSESDDVAMRPRLVIESGRRGGQSVSGSQRPQARPDTLIANGSFEQASPGSGVTSVPGWTVTRANVDVVDQAWVAADGKISLDLGGSPGNARIEQKIRTEPGQVYEVTFALAGNPWCDDPRKQLVIRAGEQRGWFGFDTTGFSLPNIGWRREAWVFRATERETRLSFANRGQNETCGAALDDVRVRRR